MSLTHILFADPPDDAARALDAFLAASPYAAYQQSRAWAAVAPRAGRHDFLVYAAYRSERPVAAAVIRRTMLSPGRWLATIQRGPLVHRAHDLGLALPGMIELLGDHGCCSVQLAPRIRGRDLPVVAEALRAAGFIPLAEDRQPLHRATGIVWLDKPEEAVLMGFRQSARRQLRAADKAGVTVRPVENDVDIATYQSLLDAFRAARPDYDMAGLPDAAGQAWLIAALGGAMLLAEKDGRAVGAHAFVRQADEAIWLSMATLDDDKTPRSAPLLWAGMRRARALGCVGYDLAGVPLADPQDDGEANRARFKASFASHKRILLPMQVAAVKPVSHAVLFSAREAYLGWKRRRSAAA